MFSFFKKSIELKIILALALILTVILSVSSAVDIWVDSKGTYQIVYLQLEGLASTIQKSLTKDMREGKSSDVQQILEMVGTEKGINAVRIFDEDGKILLSNKKPEMGGKMPAIMLQSYANKQHDFVFKESGKKTMVMMHPIANTAECFGCHDSRKKFNGILMLEYSLEPVQDYIFYNNLRIALVMLVTIIGVGIVIFMSMRTLIGRPIKRMRAAMAEAEKGNLDIVIPAGSEDEIGSLQQSFNHMLSTIKDLNQRNLSQQRDLVKKEQELTLQQVLAEKNRILESANREITEKNRYYMEMLSFISHELKNPILVLKGYSSLLMKEDLGELRPDQRDAVSAMEKQVETISEMIANYLDLSRIERGELNPKKRKLDLVNEVVRPVLHEFSQAMSKSEMRVKLGLPDAPIAMEADPALVKSAFGNLISNAVKYAWPETEIDVNVGRNSEGRAVISVLNRGNGIPRKDLEKVFGRFTRLENKVTLSRQGSGLGLCIAREIVELHGGRVWAESEEGSWAKFVIELPADNPG